MALNLNSEAKNPETCKSGDHINSLIKEMASFSIEDTKFCDVTLIAGNDGTEVKTHRMVLSAASKYFLTMFTGSLREANATEVEIKDVSGTTLKAVVNFIYTASIELATDTVEDLLKTAHLFQMNSLQDVCCNYIIKQLDSSNCLGIALFAEQYVLKTLYDTTVMFVCKNFLEVWENTEFFQLDHNQLGKFLASNELYLNSEEEVFSCLLSWLDHDRANREQFIDQLIHHIRFPLLQPTFIAANVESVCNSIESQKLLLRAYKWHLMPEQRLSLFTNEQLNMRNFKDLIVAIRGLEYSNATLSVGYYCPRLRDWIYVHCDGLPSGRTLFGSTTIDGKFIIAGGNLRSGEDTNRVDSLDLKTLKWSKLPQLNKPRYAFQMATVNGQIYAVGGYSNGEYINAVETYIPGAKKWKFVSSLNVEGHQFRVAAGLNSLYVSKQHPAQMRHAPEQIFHYVYDTVAQTWKTNWFTSIGQIFGTGTVRVASTDYYIVVTRTGITAYNLETNEETTFSIDSIPLEYTNCLFVGDRLIVYGKKNILDCNPLQNERRGIPDLAASSSEIYIARLSN